MGGGGGRGVGGGGGQGGCDRKIEVFMKIQKKIYIFFFGGGGRVRVDVIEELKFLGKFTKKNGCWGVGSGGRSGWFGGGGVRVDVNEELKFL